MKTLKAYQTPEILVFPVNFADLLTTSPNGDNDTDWDENWNGIIS